MRRRTTSVLAVLAMLLGATPAPAQEAPTLGAPPPQETVTPEAATTDGGGGGLASWQVTLIFGAGVVLLGGIAVAIVLDARQRAGAARRRRGTPQTASGASRHRPIGKERARAKGKAARAQRRRNR